MCFNSSLVQTAEIVETVFNAYIDDTLIEPLYFSSAFSLPVRPVLKGGSGRFEPLRWGLIPSWVKDGEKGRDIRYKTLNARLETLHEKASFRVPADRQRGALLADGWFEWKEVEGRKVPYFIHRSDGLPFLIAALWDSWIPAGGSGGSSGQRPAVETFSVVTTDALGICAEVHNTKLRMPLVLDQQSQKLWLDPDLTYKELQGKVRPDWKPLDAHPVSDLVSRQKEERNIPQVRKPVALPPPLPKQGELF